MCYFSIYYSISWKKSRLFTEIIEKYEENKARQENLIKEMKTLDVKLSEASRIVKANARLNDIMENKKSFIFCSNKLVNNI